MALVCLSLQTSSFTLSEVTHIAAWTWSVCLLHAVVGETMLLLYSDSFCSFAAIAALVT